jgi:tripartite-type tricarboxylate transporter receptor subunit TctC
VTDLVKDTGDRQALEVIFSRQSMGRPVVAPPGLKPDVAAALRQAFDQTMHDPQFIAECDKVGLELNYVSGSDVQALVARAYQSPPSVVAALRKIGGAPYP